MQMLNDHTVKVQATADNVYEYVVLDGLGRPLAAFGSIGGAVRYAEALAELSSLSA